MFIHALVITMVAAGVLVPLFFSFVLPRLPIYDRWKHEARAQRHQLSAASARRELHAALYDPLQEHNSEMVYLGDGTRPLDTLDLM